MKTREELIEKAYTYIDGLETDRTVEEVMADFALSLEEGEETFTVRALRKKGTNVYYEYVDFGKGIDGWMTCVLPKLLAHTATMKNYKALSKKGLIIKPPKDSELVEIEIRVKGVIEQ